MNSEIRYVSVNGARLGYDVRGEGSGKPPVIFSPGYGGRGTGELYGDFLRLLTAEFTVYALDPRGHGASASEIQDWSMGTVADDLGAFTEALGIKGAFYIGHSFGGFSGMYCEVRHPGTFSALCLINSGSAEGGGDSSPEYGQFLIDHGQDAAFLREAYGPMYVRGGDMTEHLAAAVLMHPSVHKAYFAEWPVLSIIEEVRSIALPVLTLIGGLDEVVPLATQNATAMAFPSGKAVTFTAQGHTMPVESPDLVAREIIHFWKDDVGSAALKPAGL